MKLVRTQDFVHLQGVRHFVYPCSSWNLGHVNSDEKSSHKKASKKDRVTKFQWSLDTLLSACLPAIAFVVTVNVANVIVQRLRKVGSLMCISADRQRFTCAFATYDPCGGTTLISEIY